MVFLPIVERELRVAARQPATYDARVRTALAGFLLGGMLLFFARAFGPSPVGGRQAFETLAGLAFLYCAFGGLAATADSLSGEKREGTLGLLFLTSLTGYDVVLGKLLASSLRLVYGLVAVIPILSFPVMQGGVRGSEVFGKTVVLLNTLFFSASLGLLASALSRRRDRAVAAAAGVLLLFWLGLPTLARLCTYAGLPPLVTTLLTLFSVGNSSLAGSWRTGPAAFSFWLPLFATHCVAWLFLLAASWVVPRAWQDRATSAGPPRWREAWNEWVHGPPDSRARRRTRLLNLSPFLWLVSRRRFKALPPWAGIFLLTGFLVWLWRDDRTVFANMGTAFFVGLLTHTLLRFSVAAQAVDTIAANRREGTLELLLCTSLSVAEIVRGQWLALRRQYLGPLMAILLIDVTLLLLLLFTVTTGSPLTSDLPAMAVLVGLGQMVMLVADSIAIGWVGMWLAISSPRVNHAAGGAVARILFLPGLVFLACNVVGGLLSISGRSPMSPRPFSLYGLWFCVGLLVDVAFILSSRRQLLGSFRLLAASQYGVRAVSKARWWSRLLHGER